MVSNIIWSLIIGAVAGWLAGKFLKGHGFGLWLNIIVGIIGAFIGGFILSIFGITMTGVVGQLITSTIGAVVLLWVLHLFSGNRAKTD
jgi:uncharacterized membrane protein YeaQ/YmgE (transglycosylase-associated protein family)